MSDHEAPPEARLIAERRESLRPKLSQNGAAAKIGLSGNRWRQIEKGYSTPTAGVRTRVIAPAETLARMAEVVGISPIELEAVGRHDAAYALNETRRRLGAGLKSLIPERAEDGLVAPRPQEPFDEFQATDAVLADTWREAHDLAAVIREMDSPPEELRDVARRIIYSLSAFLIIRILSSSNAAKFEHWLQRIYTEREQLFRDVTVGEPTFPWRRETFGEDHAAAAASAVQTWASVRDEMADSDPIFEGAELDTHQSEIDPAAGSGEMLRAAREATQQPEGRLRRDAQDAVENQDAP